MRKIITKITENACIEIPQTYRDDICNDEENEILIETKRMLRIGKRKLGSNSEKLKMANNNQDILLSKYIIENTEFNPSKKVQITKVDDYIEITICDVE